MSKREGEIVSFGDRICLFCGKPKKSHWEEYNEYFECDCTDAQKEREIREQIEKLKYQLPCEKFEIREEQVLYKIRK
jgi:hypothetical protein